MLPVSIRATRLAALAALTGVGGELNAGKVHLFKNQFVPSINMDLASFVEADYVGYVAQAVGTWGAPYYGPDALAHITAPGLQFQPTDGTIPNTVYGCYITNAGGTVLLFAVAFDAPVQLSDATTGLVYEPDFVYGA